MISCAKKLPPSLAVVGFAFCSTLLGQNVNVPLSNWTVPPYRSNQPTSGMTTMADLTPAIGFVGVQPCRIVDTRGGGVFTGAYGPPIMAANTTRAFDLNSAPHCTGIPATVKAYSLNFTILQPVSAPGDLRAWPTGTAFPGTSVQNWVTPGVNLANAAIIPSGTNGSLDVQTAGSDAHLLIDINGYFTDTYNAGVQFVATSSVGGQGAILGSNSSTTAGSSGVFGFQTATTGAVFGVKGQSSSTGTGSAGVYGLASAASGVLYGLFGQSASVSNEAAGVKGVDSGGGLTSTAANLRAGIRGDSASGVGVMGLSRATGVAGTLLDASGNFVSGGYLGYAAGGNAAVYAVGDISATGMKFFVEPHPSDPSKVIRYVALEGPEAGTYFRGSGRTIGGSAAIEVPESFRIVTDEEGLTVQLTPVGALVQVAVVSKTLDRILVRSSRDADFDYEVKGVRRAFRHFEPIANGSEFAPISPEARLPDYLPDEARQRLISNGTFNPDGSVNQITADRLGWTRIWAEQHAVRATADSAP